MDTLIDEIRELKRQISRLSDQLDKNDIIVPNSLRSGSDTSSSIEFNIASFTPKALELAMEHCLSEKEIGAGSGADGKICVPDVRKIISKQQKDIMVCSGINTSGTPCKRKGTNRCDGKYYCTTHLKKAEEELKRTNTRRLQKEPEPPQSGFLLDKIKSLDLLSKKEEGGLELEPEPESEQEPEEEFNEESDCKSENSDEPDPEPEIEDYIDSDGPDSDGSFE